VISVTSDIKCLASAAVRRTKVENIYFIIVTHMPEFYVIKLQLITLYVIFYANIIQ